LLFRSLYAVGGGTGEGAPGPKLNAETAGGGTGEGAPGPKLNAETAGGGTGEGAPGPKFSAEIAGGGTGEGAPGLKFVATIAGGGTGEGAPGPNAKADARKIKATERMESERTDGFNIISFLLENSAWGAPVNESVACTMAYAILHAKSHVARTVALCL
jgi:hypothetical protein